MTEVDSDSLERVDVEVGLMLLGAQSRTIAEFPWPAREEEREELSGS